MNIIINKNLANLMTKNLSNLNSLQDSPMLLKTGAKLKLHENGYYYIHGYTQNGNDAIKAIHNTLNSKDKSC